MNIKLFVITLIVSSCFISCKKNSRDANQITLFAPKVSGNLVTLNWSKLNNSLLNTYVIVRITDTTDTQSAVTITVNKETNSYIDTLPLASYVQYYVKSALSLYSYPGTVFSNKEMVSRTDLNFTDIIPMDALYDRDSRQLYLYSATGDIAIYDVQSKKVIKQIATGVKLGYCALGTFSGTKELYVSRADGWLFIYDATTLALADQINMGAEVFSVAYNNGKLFITTTDNSARNTILCYDRSSKTQISIQNSIDNVRIKFVPGSNSEVLGITYYGDPYYCQFDNTGHWVLQQFAYLNYTFSFESFEIFPDGNYFINAPNGVILTKNRTYVSSLPSNGSSFMSFDFDSTNQLIYAGSNGKAIQSYTMNTYQLTKTINTIGYPYRIFYDNGTILSVSTNTPDPAYSPYKVFTSIEQF